MATEFYPVKDNLRIVVWIFLFITAYGFTSQLEKTPPKQYLKFIIKRLILIYVPLWICDIVILIIAFCANPSSVIAYYSGSAYIWILDFFNVSYYFGTQVFLSGWYIDMLLLFIVVFPLLYFIVTKLKWFSIVPVLLLVWFFKWKIDYPFGGYLDMYILIPVIGILFYKYKVFSVLPKVKSILRIPLILLSVILFIAALCLRNEYLHYVYETIILRFDPVSTVLAIAVIAAVYMLRSDDKVSPVFEKLGKYSANIFYIHTVFYNTVFPRVGLTNPYIAFVLCFASTLLISVLLEKGKDLIKFNSKLRSGVDKLLKTGS